MRNKLSTEFTTIFGLVELQVIYYYEVRTYGVDDNYDS
jgi:hypothetical protein